MQLGEALAQISEIRSHINRTEVFRGYRSLTVGFSGVAGILAAVLQSWLIPHPADQLGAYLTLWISTATLSFICVAVELWHRTRHTTSAVARELTVLAITQFLPSVVAGGLLTLVIVRSAVEAAWMLPGLWAIVFSLGVFASHRLLPRPTFWVAVYYLTCGSVVLSGGPNGPAMSPWTMALTFGGGQLLAATIFYFTLERNVDERSS